MPPAILNCLWSQTHPQQQHIKCVTNVTKRMLPEQLSQLLGLLSHQERKKKKGSGTGELERKRRACMFWSGVFAFLNSTDRLNIYSLTQNSFYREHFKKGAERSLRSEGGGMLAGYKLMLFCTYCLLHINICWVLSYSKNKPRRAGDSIWWLQAVLSFPGLAGDGHNSSWHNFMKFHSISSIEGEMPQTATIST